MYKHWLQYSDTFKLPVLINLWCLHMERVACNFGRMGGHQNCKCRSPQDTLFQRFVIMFSGYILVYPIYYDFIHEYGFVLFKLWAVKLYGRNSLRGTPKLCQYTIMLIKIFNIVYFLPIELFLNGFEVMFWSNELLPLKNSYISWQWHLINKKTNITGGHQRVTRDRFFSASLCGKLGGALIY